MEGNFKKWINRINAKQDGSVHVYVVKETSMGLKMIKQRFGGQNKFDRWILDFDWSTATYSIQTPVLIKPKAVDY